jgi:hypothetical protein
MTTASVNGQKDAAQSGPGTASLAGTGCSRKMACRKILLQLAEMEPWSLRLAAAYRL